MADDERTDRSGNELDDIDAEDADIGAATTGDLDALISLLGHFYRGQLDRETTWRARLDRTTNWAVLVIATILTWTFADPDNPHYILLIGGLLVVFFLGIEAHRYRAYNVPRSRVRMLEEELFAGMFDPERDGGHDNWRQLMSDDLHRPAAKVSARVAVSRRLRRVYLPLLTILLAAWIVKLVVFQPDADWVAAAALPPVPGMVVLATVAAFYLVTFVVAAWPGPGGRREIEAGRTQAWRRDDE